MSVKSSVGSLSSSTQSDHKPINMAVFIADLTAQALPSLGILPNNAAEELMVMIRNQDFPGSYSRPHISDVFIKHEQLAILDVKAGKYTPVVLDALLCHKLLTPDFFSKLDNEQFIAWGKILKEHFYILSLPSDWQQSKFSHLEHACKLLHLISFSDRDTQYSSLLSDPSLINNFNQIIENLLLHQHADRQAIANTWTLLLTTAKHLDFSFEPHFLIRLYEYFKADFKELTNCYIGTDLVSNWDEDYEVDDDEQFAIEQNFEDLDFPEEVEQEELGDLPDVNELEEHPLYNQENIYDVPIHNIQSALLYTIMGHGNRTHKLFQEFWNNLANTTHRYNPIFRHALDGLACCDKISFFEHVKNTVKQAKCDQMDCMRLLNLLLIEERVFDVGHLDIFNKITKLVNELTPAERVGLIFGCKEAIEVFSETDDISDPDRARSIIDQMAQNIAKGLV